MKQLLTGNEAIARGAYEAGVHFASAYPGTPSTEILENLSLYKEIKSEWAPNEKVAAEAAIGASMAGGRSIVSMKHVGMNVAADPLFTYAYTGLNGGMVVITADEPGMHSSQNEQDNRNYAKAMKVPLLEPADSQECKDMVKLAFELSETFDTFVIVRVTTRVCHSKGIVECLDRVEVPIKEYVKDVKKYIPVPAHGRALRMHVEERMNKLREYSNTSPLNRIEDGGQKTGVIADGMCYYFAREVFGEDVAYLKLGFTNPLPDKLIKQFCEGKDTIYVLEENDPYVEDFVKSLGISCHGLDTFPYCGEMTPDVVRKAVFGKTYPTLEFDTSKIIARPPTLCAGCPHRGFFYELGKRKNVMVTGDIGCYTLAFAEPYNSVDCSICMGASFSAGHGAQQIFNMKKDCKTRVVATLGDSTFFHSGITSLLEVVYNHSNTVSVILDNRITGMTGHQENPGSGYNAMGDPASMADIEAVVRALGIKNITVVNPNDLAQVKNALDWALALDEPSVIITRWPCALKRFSPEDKKEFEGAFTTKNRVDSDRCIGCRACIRSGCPAISYHKDTKKAAIDPVQCVGCDVCSQLCPKQAIVKEEK